MQVWRAKIRPGLSPWSVPKKRRLTRHDCAATARTAGLFTLLIGLLALFIGLFTLQEK